MHVRYMLKPPSSNELGVRGILQWVLYLGVPTPHPPQQNGSATVPRILVRDLQLFYPIWKILTPGPAAGNAIR
jgi:hypothetical protein